MNLAHETAEARAPVLSLRASAKVCRPEHRPLKFRLMRAADALHDIALDFVDRVAKLKQSVVHLRRQGGAP